MGKKTVHVSDFSGAVIGDDADVVRIVVLEHPDLMTGPVQLEALAAEVESIDDAALDVVVVDIFDALGDGEARRVTLNASEFDALATGTPMAEVLKTAERVKPPKSARKTPADKLDYATLEHAGKPHRGKTTDEEAELVRENLDKINERLTTEGLRTIDPTHPEHAARYGFPDPATEA